MKILGVIPARYGSTRFPGKPLIDIEGTSMVMRVYQQAKKASGLTAVVVATDDHRIFDHVREEGGEVIMTRADHATGTDRVLEVVRKLPAYDAYVNIQGDEPFIHPDQINLVCDLLNVESGAFVATLVKRMQDPGEADNPNVIKVIRDVNGRAIYFSRSPLPYVRDAETIPEWHNQYGFFKHIGIYGYSAASLHEIRSMEPGRLEIAESLEQLRWMENGLPILTRETTMETRSIDTPEDLEIILANRADAQAGKV